MDKNMDRRMKLQSAEFDTLDALVKALKGQPAIVDDDYPEWRHRYEGAVERFAKALLANRPHLMQEARPTIRNFDAATLAILHDDVDVELTGASVWPPMNSAHEGYGVLAEEFDELFQHVKTKQKKRDLAAMRKEAIQVAAMAIRFAHDVCNEQRGRR